MMSKHLYFISGWASGQQINEQTQMKLNLKRGHEIVLPWSSFLHNEKIQYKKIEEGAVLIGWSIGGLIALKMALNKGEKIKAMVLISSCSRMCENESYIGVKKSTLKSMSTSLKIEKNRTLSQFSKLCFSPNLSSENKELYLEESKNLEISDLDEGLDFLRTQDLRDELSKIKIPVLILHGDKDQVMPLTTSLYLDKHLENSQLIILKNKGHAFFIDEPHILQPLIRKFLDEL